MYSLEVYFELENKGYKYFCQLVSDLEGDQALGHNLSIESALYSMG